MSAQPWSASVERDVMAAAGGDALAYARLVEQHQNLVSSIALAQVRDVAASEDVAQEVFLLAWAGLPRLRNPRSFLPWLRQLTRNRAVEFLRAHRPGAREAAGDTLLAELPDERPAVDQRMIDAQSREAIADCLEVTFASRRHYRFGPTSEVFPGPLDRANNPSMPDLFLGSCQY